MQGADDEFQGLYIPEQEVDSLLPTRRGCRAGLWQPARWRCRRSAPRWIGSRPVSPGVRRTACARFKLRLDELARLFELTPFDVDALLICLAPEIDLRYERLYAYLQDDITKKRPSVDLVLNLLSPSFDAKLASRQRFAPQAPLVKHGLLSVFDDPSQQQPPLLGKYLKADERVVSYLFESDEMDARLLPYAQAVTSRARIDDLLLPADLKRRLISLTRDPSQPLVFYFQGPYGVGKQTAAEALCQELGRRLLVVDGERLINAEELAFETAVRLIMREALLQDAVLYWDGFDRLLSDERLKWRVVLLRALEEQPGLTILAGDSPWEPADVFQARPFVRVEFPRPAYRERLSLWQASLDGATPEDGEADLLALASKFRFSGGQIRDAAATARNLARWRDPDGGRVTAADLQAACSPAVQPQADRVGT